MVEQLEFPLGETKKVLRFEGYSHKELVQRIEIMEGELKRLVRENYSLRKIEVSAIQLEFAIEEQIASLKDQLYGASSERYKKPQREKTQTPPKPRVKKPSERYPNIPIREVVIDMAPAPNCLSCGKQMSDSGMTEDSEQLTVVPKKYEILIQKRKKYRCTCQSCIQTAPAPARIIEGSSYSDEMILDVALSKYCDLIPIERYCAMASRSGLIELPPHSLIETSHGLAKLVSGVYVLLKEGSLASRVLKADETPHRMLYQFQKLIVQGASLKLYCNTAKAQQQRTIILWDWYNLMEIWGCYILDR